MLTRYFALVAGIIYLLVGLLGFVPGLRAPYSGPDLAIGASSGLLLGLFPINLVHNLVHLAIGIWGIAAYRSFNGAIAFARGLTILYVLLAILGLLPAPISTAFGLVPIFGHDIWLHLVTGLIAAYFGWVAPARTRPEYVDASRRR